MKGLLINNFYSSIGNIKLFLTIVLAVAAIVLVTGNPTAQELFVYITITALSINAVVSSRKDAISNWNKFEITMPVRRTDIIKSKYLSYIFWLGVGTGLALAVTMVTMLVHGIGNDIYSMFALGIGISLFVGALFFPIAYLVGTDKSETVLIISVLVAITLAVLILNVLNQFISYFIVRMAAFITIYILFFAFSYVITLRIYAKKEL
ncbi:MAG: ABC-2 transporter permease [Lachnospiraceae bacterium]|nr:ABC-2 transporter permease [Lachnospiraceae bacterium]